MGTLEENRFVKQELDKWGNYVLIRLQQALKKRNIGVSKSLLHSLKYRVFHGTKNNDGFITLMFNEYGRMVDMGAGRKRSLRKGESIHDNKVKWMIRGRQPNKWYSKTVWGTLDFLINNLINEYQDFIVKEMKTTLTNSK